MIAELCGKRMYSFVRNSQTFPEWLHWVASLPGMYPHFCQHLVFSDVLDFDYSNRYIGACLCVLVHNSIIDIIDVYKHFVFTYLVIFFGEVTLQVFCPFFKKISCSLSDCQVYIYF